MNDELPPAAVAALHEGRKIDAIKIVRQSSRLGLKEAKEAVERFERSHSGNGIERDGPVQRGGRGAGMVLLILVAAAVLAVVLLRG